MKPLRKARAGGIIRKSLDQTWRTPERILACARHYFGGQILLDPATGLENPTRAARFCAGVTPRKRQFVLALALARGLALRDAMSPFEADESWEDAWLWAVDPMVAEQMPFRSGLEIEWNEPAWVNPPYGREIRDWLSKIETEAKRGTEIVGLLPCARWEQRYFQRVLAVAKHKCLIRGRVAFISSIDHVPVSGNPYASMLIGWNTNEERFLDAFHVLGSCLSTRALRRRYWTRIEIDTAQIPLFSAQEGPPA